MVRDIRDGAEGSNPDFLTAFNDSELGNLVVFVADEGPVPLPAVTAGRELWRSDGSTGGTRLQSDIRPGILSSGPEDLVVSGNILFFTADDGTRGRELWKMQRIGGRGIVTVLVRDIRP
jgi:ELWxxDGT repeat protein